MRGAGGAGQGDTGGRGAGGGGVGEGGARGGGVRGDTGTGGVPQAGGGAGPGRGRGIGGGARGGARGGGRGGVGGGTGGRTGGGSSGGAGGAGAGGDGGPPPGLFVGYTDGPPRGFCPKCGQRFASRIGFKNHWMACSLAPPGEIPPALVHVYTPPTPSLTPLSFPPLPPPASLPLDLPPGFGPQQAAAPPPQQSGQQGRGRGGQQGVQHAAQQGAPLSAHQGAQQQGVQRRTHLDMRPGTHAGSLGAGSVGGGGEQERPARGQAQPQLQQQHHEAIPPFTTQWAIAESWDWDLLTGQDVLPPTLPRHLYGGARTLCSHVMRQVFMWAVEVPSEARWGLALHFHILVCRPQLPGDHQARDVSQTTHISSLCRRFMRGEWEELFLEAVLLARAAARPSPPRASRQHTHSMQESSRRRCIAAVHQGSTSRGLQALTSSSAAPGTARTLEGLQARHPAPSLPFPSWVESFCPPSPLPTPTLEEIGASLRSAPRGASG